MSSYWVYIMASKNRRALYIGVTSNLEQRVGQHKGHLLKGSFSDRYNTIDLIYCEEYPEVEDAIAREKQLKNWSRSKKEKLIRALNPEMRDLAADETCG